MIRVAYIRPSKAHPEAEQRAALATVDLTDPTMLYVEEMPRRKKAAAETRDERDRAIHACRPVSQDELWIASPGVWGTVQADALAALQRLTERGAVLCIVSTGTRHRWHPDAASAIEFARLVAAENQNAATASARKAAAIRRERDAEEQEEALKEAKRLWTDKAVTVAQVVERTGLAQRTLYRKLGPKGTEPFTGGPKRRGKGRRK